MVRVLKCVVDMLRFDCARNSQGMSGQRCITFNALFGMVKCVIHMLSFAHARNNQSMRCCHALVNSVSVEGVIHWFTWLRVSTIYSPYFIVVMWLILWGGVIHGASSVSFLPANSFDLLNKIGRDT